MIQTVNTNSLREDLLYEVNHSNNETLKLFYNIIKAIKTSFPKEEKTIEEKETIHKNHPLLDSFGVINEQSGQEMIDCVNRKFNEIEDIHSSYKISTPVLATDWDSEADKHWDKY